MDESKAEPGRLEPVRAVMPSLTQALRRARLESAERSEVLAELRGAETARLEILSEALQPVLTQIPEGIDLFDTGIVPGEHPRLFVDMIGFVEMGRDRRQYRFLQDTRHGRVLIVESERVEVMLEAITAYIARRLVEREKALASDRTLEEAARLVGGPDWPRPSVDAAVRPSRDPASAQAHAARPQAPPLRPGRRHRRLLLQALVFVIEYLGVLTLMGLLIAAGFIGYQTVKDHWRYEQAAPTAAPPP
jgi:hypothetical protein